MDLNLDNWTRILRENRGKDRIMKDIDEPVPRVESLNFDSIISAAAYSVRYITKLSKISFEETTMRELTVQPARATTDYKKTIVVREPSVMECRFLDLPVSLLKYAS